MQDYQIGSLIQTPTDLLANPADRLRVNSRTEDGNHRQDVRKVAKEFESLFVANLLKVMRETIEEANQGEDGVGKGIYTELFDQEFARTISQQRGIGISDLLVKGLREESKTGKTGEEQILEPGSPIPVPQPLPASQDSAGKAANTGEDVPDFRLPVQAPVSSTYGMRKDPFTHNPRFHKGLDLAAPAGMDVRAAKEGEVVYAGFQPGYGNTVVVQHSGGLQTRYAHLGSTSVRVGDTIAAEQVIGTVGDTGHSTGPHLHFEVTRWGRNVDPLSAMTTGTNSLKGGGNTPDALTE